MKKGKSLMSGNVLWFILALIIATILFSIKFTEKTGLILPDNPMAGDLLVRAIINIIAGMIISIPITALICFIFPQKE